MLKIKSFLSLAIFTVSTFSVFSQTEDWRQYSFGMAGFSVKYPSDWESVEEGVGAVLHAGFISPAVRDDDVTENAGIAICTQPKGHISTSSNSRSRCRQRDDHLSEMHKDKVVSDETVEINGLKIRKKITEDKYAPNTTYIYAFFSTKNKDVLISSSFPRRFDLDKYIPVFNRMLSTIRLLEKETVLIYRNEKYGFSVEYPASWRSCPLGYKKKEYILMLVPEGGSGGCFGGNYISILTVPEFSDPAKKPDLREFLRRENYSEIAPDMELTNLSAVSGEKAEGKYIYRQRYFSVNKSETYNLLKISEMYDTKQESFQMEAGEILATIERF